MTVSDRIRVKNVRVLSDNYATLKDTTFEWRRANGEWQTQAPRDLRPRQCRDAVAL